MRKRRLLFMMLIMFFCLSSAIAQDNKKISMTFKNEKLSDALRQLEKASTYKIMFTYNEVEVYRVTGKVKDQTFEQALRYVLEGKPLEYSISGKLVTVKSTNRTKPALQGNRNVSGYVKDETGEPLIGVPVCIGESRVCTVTDVNGFYTFPIPQEETILKFSYVGLGTEYVQIAQGIGDVKRDVVMRADNKLDEVVVTGIFRKARESYTGSVSTIDKEQLEQFRGQNLLQTLKNVDASINFGIDNLNGSNPNNLPNINIRGTSSLPMSVEEFNAGQSNNPNTPLIIMDGFEISLTKLMDYNDEEIESINILKDAAATAIYGSRGANGVIVVISKQPEPGKLRVNLEAGLALEVPDLTSYHLLNAVDKLELERKAGLYDYPYNMDVSMSSSDVHYIEAYNRRHYDVLRGVDTDWLSKPLRTGVGQRYNLRVEGGSKEFRWAADAQWKDTEGAMKGSNRRIFNGGITLLYTFKNLTFRNYTSVGINNSKESPYGTFSDYVNQQPYNAPYDEDGNLRKFFDPFMSYRGAPENPLYNATLGSFNKSGYQELTNNFAVDWQILPELTLRGQLGISKNDSETNFFRSPEDTYYQNDSSGQYTTGEGFLRRGYYRYTDGKSISFNADVTLSYNKVFQEVHSLYVGANWSMRQNNYDGFTAAFEGISSDTQAKIGNARMYAQNEMPYGTNTKTHMFGVTGNVNYTYGGKYYVDFSYRVDGNSTYGSDKKYSSFYSAGIGWNLHNEAFLKGNEVINMLRLKASYGETGAASGALETDAYTYFNYVTDNRYMNWTGAELGGLGNPDLTWQLTKEFNVGTEFGLWDNRVRGTFEYYIKNTNNLLSSMDMPLSMGFPSYRANIGEVKNNGWEASLQVYAIRDRARQFNWLIGGQLVYNKNKITKLSQAIKDQTEAFMMSDRIESNTDTGTGIQNLFYEGYPQNAIYAVRSLGIDPSTGNELYLDKDGNFTDVWKESNKVYCGSADPKYRGNLNTMVQWKDFTLNASFGYYWGGKMYNSTLRDRVEVTLNTIAQRNVDERVLTSRWYQEGDVVFFRRLGATTSKASSRYVMDNNVLELQSVSLQYKLHNDWLRNNFKLQSAIFGLNMNDLIHWGTIRMERGTSYPFARNIQASVKLLF
ncbi:MAG: SusC/RagA family TonB-linked outer membrane protein [Prevotella sp.]|nr:SusC/RagA family TonB-linked outer membrane protein [Prevotella sp.]